MSLPTRVQRSIADFPFDAFNQDFGTALNRFFNNRQGEVLAPYAVDVREDTDHIYVEADLPGFKKEEVDITLENGTLTLAAEHKAETKKEGNGGANGGDWLLNERRYSRFLRSFTLPPTVDPSTVDAKLADGVLKVTLSKRAETKPRKITVA